LPESRAVVGFSPSLPSPVEDAFNGILAAYVLPSVVNRSSPSVRGGRKKQSYVAACLFLMVRCYRALAVARP
jgi:hypothetical protein